MVHTLSADFLLRKHNAEIYLMKKIEPELFFLGIMPMAQTDTGEFPTVLQDPTATEDTEDEVMSEPMDVTEASELTEIEISPLNAILGRTMACGYTFKYTDKFLNRSDSGARVQLALSKIAAGIAMKVNTALVSQIVAAAGVAVPGTLSDWDTEIDPRADNIKLRHAMHPKDSPFRLTDAYIPDTKFQKLEEYYMSMDWAFDSNAIDVDGTIYHNVMDSFSGLAKNFLGIDRNIPAGIVEKYVDPKYSTLAAAQLADPQKTVNLPSALINVLPFEPGRMHEQYGFDIWAEVGYSNQEPKGAMAGSI
jgi:hypothetical protein